jgi:hypothetical protein
MGRSPSLRQTDPGAAMQELARGRSLDELDELGQASPSGTGPGVAGAATSFPSLARMGGLAVVPTEVVISAA